MCSSDLLERHFATPVPKEPLVLKARSGNAMKINYTDDVRRLSQSIVDLNSWSRSQVGRN